MRRRLYKGAIIEKVEHRTTKRTGVIRLDKDSMMFFARENDGDPLTEPYADKDGGKVRAWLMVQLGHTTEADRLEWLPVIRITNDSRHGYRYARENQKHGEELDVEFERFYIALTRDKREWRKLEWEACDPESSGLVPDNERYAQSHRYDLGPAHDYSGSKPFRLPSFDGSKCVVGYTPELWRGLHLILKQIEGARKALTAMIGTKAGIETVAEVGAGKTPLLLAAPAKE